MLTVCSLASPRIKHILQSPLDKYTDLESIDNNVPPGPSQYTQICPLFSTVYLSLSCQRRGENKALMDEYQLGYCATRSWCQKYYSSYFSLCGLSLPMQMTFDWRGSERHALNSFIFVFGIVKAFSCNMNLISLKDVKSCASIFQIHLMLLNPLGA